jgi:outer membrane receptor protein involved in Fe transport
MKILFLSLFLILAGISGYAQSKDANSPINQTLKGQVVDSLNKETIPYATIKILEETPERTVVKVVVTDENGNFTLALNTPGAYLLTVEFLGKKTAVIPFTAEDKSLRDIGKIELADDAHTQDEIDVTAQKPLVKVDLDKITYSLDDDPDSKTNNVLEMLKKVPMVTVDGEENIQLKGSSNFKFYMNGKPSSLISNNPKDVLKSIPANTIKSIEVITDPGAKYDAEGVTGIINIITQSQSSLGGYTVSLNAGAGFGSRKTYNTGTYFSIKYGKIGLTGNVNYFNSKTADSQATTLRKDFLNQTILTQNGLNASHYNGVYGYGELSYEIDTLNLINISLNRYGGDSQSDIQQDVIMSELLENGIAQETSNEIYRYKRISATKNAYGNSSMGVDYQKTFSVKDRLLTASYRLDTSPNDMESDNLTEQGFHFDNGHNKQYSKASTTEHTFQLDYTTPVAQIHTLEAGAKYIRRINESNSNMSLLLGDAWVSFPSNNDKFEHLQNIFAAYAGYSLKYKQWGLKAGLRYEATDLNVGFPLNAQQNFNVSYSNLVPSATVTYMLKQGQTLRAGYNMRIQRPGIWYLNPFVNTTDTNYIRFGNPKLDAVKYHSLTLNYNLFKPKFNMNANLSYSFTNNAIEEVTWIEDKVSKASYFNVAQNKSIYISTYLNWSPNPKIRLYGNLGGSYINLKANDNSGLKNSGFAADIYGGAQYTFPWSIRFNLGGYYSTPNISLQGESEGYYFYNTSVSKSFLKNSLNIRLYVNNPFHKTLDFSGKQSSSDFYYEYMTRRSMRSYGLSVSYRFGEMKTQIKKAQRGIQNDDNMGGGSQSGGSGGEGAQ